MKTLKENYNQKQTILENNRAQLIIEALNEKDLQTATTIIDKLRKIKGKGLKNLDVAIDQAEAEINKYTGGGLLTKAWTKLKSLVGIDNPLVKIMTFANALENGFRQMPTILNNNIDLSKVNKDNSLTQLGLNQQQTQTILNNMRKALSPSGLFTIFKKVPYIETDNLINDLLNVPIKNLETVIQVAQTGPQTNELAPDMKDQLRPGTAQTTKTTEDQPTQQTQKNVGTTTAKNPTVNQPPRTGEQAAPETKNLDFNSIRDKIGNDNLKKLVVAISQNTQDPGKAATQVLTLLAKAGLLKV